MALTLRPQSHVVVVDRQPTGYHGLVELAEEHDWHVHFLTSARAALHFAGRLSADLWMVHVSLPEMSGFDLYEILREQVVEATAFMVSDQYNSDDEHRACRIGAALYLCKDAERSIDCEPLLKSLLPLPTRRVQKSY
jgi:DNA-binding response OmpR family regulator